MGCNELAVNYPVKLQTKEPNNNIGILRIRQSDEETQVLEVEVLDGALPMSYEGLQVFFCARIGQTAGLGIIEQKLTDTEMTDPKNGKLEYTFRAEDWQVLGRQTGYFSFRKMKDDHTYEQQFSTRDFTYEVTKSIYSDGIKEVKKDGSTYVWTFEDLLRLLEEFKESGETNFLTWFEEIKDQLSEDAAGNLMLLYQSLRDKTGSDNDFRPFESDLSYMQRVFNENEERGVNVKWFGAKGDGVTDDAKAIQDCFRYASENNKAVYFPPGRFLVNTPIVYDGRFSIIGSGTTTVIKCGSDMDYLFVVDKSNDNLNPDINLIVGSIESINFNGNDLADYAFYAKKGKAVNLNQVNSTGAKLSNMRLGSLDNPDEKCWEWNISNIHLNGRSGDFRPNYGIDIGNNFVDSSISDVVVTNAKKTLFNCYGNTLTISDIHPYTTPISNSCECLVRAGGVGNRWDNLYLDTPDLLALSVEDLGQTFNNIYLLCPDFYTKGANRKLINVKASTSISNLVFSAPTSIASELAKTTMIYLDNSINKIEEISIKSMFCLNARPNKDIDLLGKMPYRITADSMNCEVPFSVGRFKKLLTVYSNSVGEIVTLNNEFQNTYYQIIPEIGWDTNWWIEEKTTTSFKFKVAKAPGVNTIVPIRIMPY